MALQTFLQYNLFFPPSSSASLPPKKDGDMISASLCGVKQQEGLKFMTEAVGLWIGRSLLSISKIVFTATRINSSVHDNAI